MRGPDEQTSHMFSYLSPEARVRPDDVGGDPQDPSGHAFLSPAASAFRREDHYIFL